MNTYFDEKVIKNRRAEKGSASASAAGLIPLFLLIILSAGLIVGKDAVARSVVSACRMCLTSLIPAIFPFMVLSEIFIRYLSSDKAPLLSAFLVGNLCGFPIGAKILADLYSEGRISTEQYSAYLPICSNPGLAFTVVGVGANLWNSYVIGIELYLMTLLSGAIIFLLFFRKNAFPIEPQTQNSPQNDVSPQSFSRALVAAVTNGTEKILRVCGFVIFFSAITSLICGFSDSINLPSVFSALFCSVTEISGATALLAETAQSGSFTAICLALTFFSHGFGGFCIYAQILSVSSKRENVMENYLLFKLLQGLVCALSAAALMYFHALRVIL